MPAMTKSGMFFTEARIVEAVWLFWICALLSRPEIVVNVPGNMINPARRIHLNSTVGDKALWENAQNIAKKNKASLT